MNYDLSLIYEVAYPYQLPFDSGKKDFSKFIYSIMVASAVDLNEGGKNNIDFINLYLYHMSRAGFSLDDLYKLLSQNERLKKLKIDKELYTSYCDDALFDAVNSIQNIRAEYFDKIVGLNNYYNIDFIPFEFIIEYCNPEELIDFDKKPELSKEYDDFVDYVKKMFISSQDYDYIKSIKQHIKNENLKPKDVANEIKKLLNDSMDVTISIFRESIKENIEDNLIEKTIKRVEERKKEEKANQSSSNLANLDKLKSLIIGQDEAIVKIIDKIKGSYVGFKSSHEPVASFLLTGPTGVGKTETAKAVANLICDGHIYIIDMTSFKTKEDISRLIGASPNYVGYGDKNYFTTFLTEHPNGVLLFDEIEKGHEQCLDLLMRMLDEAEFVDSKGNRFSLEKNIIFCTTNFTSHKMHLGFDAHQESVEQKLTTDGLRKEIVGRFHEVIEYKPLINESCITIAKAFLDKRIKNFMDNNSSRAITLKYTNELVEKIIKDADTNLLGARDLKKSIQKNFVSVISNYIYKYSPVNCTIIVDVDGVHIKENINTSIATTSNNI